MFDRACVRVSRGPVPVVRHSRGDAGADRARPTMRSWFFPCSMAELKPEVVRCG